GLLTSSGQNTCIPRFYSVWCITSEEMDNDEGVMLPVIDLKDISNQSNKLVEACKEWGSFRVVNHDIPLTLLSEMKSVVRYLLDLPVEIKKRNIDEIAGSGYVALSKQNPLYEALGLYDLGSSQAVQEFCNQLGVSSNQRETIMQYSSALHKLMMDLWNKLAESMGVRLEKLEEWKCQFRINKYHFREETVGSTGVQIHTDSGFLTILQEDESVGGLEVLPRSSLASGSYVPVHPVAGTLLVNLGDMATVWSNGMLYNVKHRVVCKEAAIRVSIAMFLLGTKEAVEARPEFVDGDHPRLYLPVTYEEYRKLRLSSGYRAGEALDLMHLTTASRAI
ncbi:2-oxoglutarate-dependent dioxygenase, partial [Thalictrum thalictroides]